MLLLWYFALRFGMQMCRKKLYSCDNCMFCFLSCSARLWALILSYAAPVDQWLLSTDAWHGHSALVHLLLIRVSSPSLLPLRSSEKGHLSILIHGLDARWGQQANLIKINRTQYRGLTPENTQVFSFVAWITLEWISKSVCRANVTR